MSYQSGPREESRKGEKVRPIGSFKDRGTSDRKSAEFRLRALLLHSLTHLLTVEKPLPNKHSDTHNRSKQCDKPIRIPGNHLSLSQKREKSRVRVQGTIGFGFSSVES